MSFFIFKWNLKGRYFSLLCDFTVIFMYKIYFSDKPFAITTDQNFQQLIHQFTPQLIDGCSPILLSRYKDVERLDDDVLSRHFRGKVFFLLNVTLSPTPDSKISSVSSVETLNFVCLLCN